MSAQNKQKLTSYNPANLNVLGEVNVSNKQDVLQAIEKAHAAKKQWKEIGVAKRAEHLKSLHAYLSENLEKFAMLETQEMGRPIDGSLGVVEWALSRMEWNLDNAPSILAPEINHEDDENIHEVHYEPYGVAGVITPWNFPMSNFVMGAVQPLLAGNTVVYKSSEEVPMCGQALEEAFKQSDVPEGVFNVVYGAGETGEALSHGDIDMIHFTGSSAVGKKLYKIAAEKFIPATLELGGSDAGIVFEDAILSDEILESIFWAKFVNCGQICCG